MKCDRFPLFNSTSLTHLELVALTLPNMVIQPSLLILPNLNTILIYQEKDAQWFHVTPIVFLILNGLQHLYSYQFVNIPLLEKLQLGRFFTDFTFEINALTGLDALEHLYIQQTHTPTNFDFPTNEIFPSLTHFHSANNAITTLDQSFFERQKALSVINASSGNPFHYDCKMAWLNHVSTNLGWTVLGGCDTPASLYGNSITDSSNYLNCPNNQSYHCFNDTFLSPGD